MYIYVNGIAYNLKKLHLLLKNYPFMLKFKICLKQKIFNEVFYKREILDYIFSEFDSVNEVYFMLKEAL